jgi:hypothetical protein
MTERDIAYDRTGADSVGLCPTCWWGTENAVACNKCLAAHLERLCPASETGRDVSILDARDAFYDLGIRLRASSELPPLTKPEVLPVCKDCKAQPCDCGEPIWNRRWRLKDGVRSTSPYGEWWVGNETEGFTRAYAELLNRGSIYEYGPVQRITDPPFEFPKREGSRSVRHGMDATAPLLEYPRVDVARAVPCGSFTCISSEEQLAKLLWRTDVRVSDFLARVADHRVVDGPSEATDGGRLQRAREIAWERNEGGWRTEAEARAKDMFVVAEG